MSGSRVEGDEHLSSDGPKCHTRRHTTAKQSERCRALPGFHLRTNPENFCKAEVKQAIAAIQQRQIGYRDFLSRIMAAGCLSAAVRPYRRVARATFISSYFQSATAVRNLNLSGLFRLGR